MRAPSHDSRGGHPIFEDGSGGYRLDMNTSAAGLAGGEPSPALRTPGAVVHCQWWARDPGGPAGSSLTEALRYVVGP